MLNLYQSADSLEVENSDFEGSIPPVYRATPAPDEKCIAGQVLGGEINNILSNLIHTEKTLGRTALFFDFDRFNFVGTFTNNVRSTEGNSEKDHQFFKSLRISHMGGIQIETSGFQANEKRFNGPAFRIKLFKNGSSP